MLNCHYHLANSETETTLRAESHTALKATRSFVKNVTKTNPARDELLSQILLMEQSIEDSKDCELSELKHGYLRSVFLNLFDAGDAELICGDDTYTNDMLQKEDWSAGEIPGFSRGGYGGFQYRSSDGQTVLSESTWIS